MKQPKAKSTCHPCRLQVQITSADPDAHLGLVIRYLQDQDCNVRAELIELLKSRFLPAAMQHFHGEVKKSAAFGCIGSLKGFAAEIEELIGVQPILDAALPATSASTAPASNTLQESFDDDDVDDRVNEPDSTKTHQERIALTNRIFGFGNTDSGSSSGSSAA